MSWKISQKIADILKKGSDNEGIDRDEALALMQLELHSRETYALMQTANSLSREQFNGKGENHSALHMRGSGTKELSSLSSEVL